MPEADHSDEAKRRPESKQIPLSGPARIILRILFTLLMLLSLVTYFQRSLIYHPYPCPRLLASRANLPQGVVDVTVMSHDGLELHGWLALAKAPPDTSTIDVKQALDNGRPVVLYFPGNGGNRSMRWSQLAVLGSLDAHVLIVDYRGFADNAGKPSEQNFARDARSIWNHLTQQLGVPAHRIIVYGESLGGGSAVRLASELCQAGIEPGGLIAQSSFSSLVAAAKYHYPILPVSLLLVDRFPSDVRIKQVTCPILQIHGQRDRVVPFAIGQKLYDAAPAKSSRGVAKQQIVMPYTDHNDVYAQGLDQILLEAGLTNFIEEVAHAPEPDLKPGDASVLANQKSAAGFVLTDHIDETILISVVLVLLAALAYWLRVKVFK